MTFSLRKAKMPWEVVGWTTVNNRQVFFFGFGSPGGITPAWSVLSVHELVNKKQTISGSFLKRLAIYAVYTSPLILLVTSCSYLFFPAKIYLTPADRYLDDIDLTVLRELHEKIESWNNKWTIWAFIFTYRFVITRVYVYMENMWKLHGQLNCHNLHFRLKKNDREKLWCRIRKLNTFNHHTTVLARLSLIDSMLFIDKHSLQTAYSLAGHLSGVIYWYLLVKLCLSSWTEA